MWCGYASITHSRPSSDGPQHGPRIRTPGPSTYLVLEHITYGVNIDSSKMHAPHWTCIAQRNSRGKAQSNPGRGHVRYHLWDMRNIFLKPVVG